MASFSKGANHTAGSDSEQHAEGRPGENRIHVGGAANSAHNVAVRTMLQPKSPTQARGNVAVVTTL
jgi:hypothetical protein